MSLISINELDTYKNCDTATYKKLCLKNKKIKQAKKIQKILTDSLKLFSSIVNAKKLKMSAKSLKLFPSILTNAKNHTAQAEAINVLKVIIVPNTSIKLAINKAALPPFACNPEPSTSERPNQNIFPQATINLMNERNTCYKCLKTYRKHHFIGNVKRRYTTDNKLNFT